MKAWAYKDFKIGDLFSAQTGDTDLQQKDINGKGTYFINSGVEAQGIKGKTDREAKVFNSNTITVDFWGNAYYRDFEYKMATHNHVFSLSGDVIKNRSVGLYLVTAMSYMKKMFSYNNMGTWSKIKELYIHLPVTETGDIDFVYIESRIREMEESRIREMEAYLKVSGFENCELTEEEKNAIGNYACHDKKEVIISSIFNIKKGKRLTKDNMLPGSINFVGSTASNNGITATISNSSHIHDGNTITVTYNGSVGEAFYQSDRYWASDDVNVLNFKQELNEPLALFMCASLRKSGKKYAYGYKWKKELMEKDKIILPVTSSGSIDYQFMETYIRAIEKLTIQRVKDWRDKEIAATKNIVEDETNDKPLQTHYISKQYCIYEDNAPMIAAEDIYIYGSIPVDLPDTKRTELIDEKLSLILMYAIGSGARRKTETAGKIALGIKENMLKDEQIAAYKSLKYLMFHYWSNPMAYQLTKEPVLVDKEAVPADYLVRLDKDVVKFLLLEYNPQQSADLGNVNILKTQRRGEIRYLPFVTTVESIKDEMKEIGKTF